MPKAPILTRTAVFIPVSGSGGGSGDRFHVRGLAGVPSYRRYEWNIVTTSLGTMLELRGDVLRGNVSGLPGTGMANEDVYETDLTDIKIMTVDQLAQIGAAGALGGGDTLPRRFDLPGVV